MSSSSYSSQDEAAWVTPVALIAVTLQLIRCAIDLIQVASQTTPKAATVATATTTPTPTTATATTYGSVSSSNGGKHHPVSSSVEEGQALLNGKEAFRNSSTASSSTNDFKRQSRRFVVAWWILVAVYSLASLHATRTFPAPLLIASAGCALVEVLLTHADPTWERQGKHRTVHGALQGLSYTVLASLVAIRLTVHHDKALGVALKLEHVLLILATISLIFLGILQGRILSQRMMQSSLSASPAALEQAQSNRKRLNRQALYILLKPYFWPDATNQSALQNRVRAVLTWVCVILSKVCGVASPLFLGWATTALAHGNTHETIKQSCLYCLVSFMSSTFKEGQSLIYLKVAQAAFCQLAQAAFGHLHALSLDWHLRKKMGEVLRSMDRGIAACDTLMKYLFLWLVPALAECLVVCLIFATYFHYWPLAGTVFYFVFLYVVWTILLTLWRKQFRKALVKSDNDWHDLFTDSMMNFETVKYFTAEDYERQRFSSAVTTYQTGSVHVQASLSFLNVSQQVILKTCLGVALGLSAHAIQQRLACCVDQAGCESGLSDCCLAVSYDTCPGMQVGDFVAVLTYTVQLFSPLNFLGSVYNAVVMAVIDLTHLSELLAEHPDVQDAPDAMTLPSKNESEPDVCVEFDNVVFHYPTQPAEKGLKGLSFKMKRGTTTAIVGPTGAGKTTISRLLFRFYDVLGGAVKVNGVDVRTVTQASLRGAMGVVPQAASMFNDTIRANLLYGRRDASQEELEQAAKDAQLYDFIMSLDDQWESMVGDRGLKLSGGEKQRAAIARCLLKDPPIVLLDEATSALDTLTESSVQQALDRLGAERTVLVIAHRLGTIRNADNIVVVQDGTVAEQGTHDELLAKQGGLYAEMWNMQLHSNSGNTSRVSLGNLINELSMSSP